MEAGLEFLVVRGFAVREGRGKWACCFEIRLAAHHEQGCGADGAAGSDEPLLYRGELHGRQFDCELAAADAARAAGEREALLRVESLKALIIAQHRHRVPPSLVS
ncbi:MULTISPECIES: hypothetical protein [Cupriavidus]|uniref:Uncharacterized protein n=2 Tax=Cupriavidus TaxID=106589 RepID=A0A375CAE6_9BURK|nr:MULTISPECIES: hypothetical protein [Cupriavidus]NUO89195.1 hypothetical protein [Cupriavidus sp.]MEC3764034.1 hypothetical protein [Cupriavidus sp. SS-3]PZX24711.1 hypothetical protein C7416_109114 [Cupriavidus alkaliphilus]SOY65984.1 conserved hypothetical protein [Cupriavidus taiwanensis]SPA29961.1 conserved hypothetical protein [Cupriavidus taiwanensis]